MRVEVLYVAECPSHRAAVKLVREVLAAQGVAAEIQEVLVKDGAMASELRFLVLRPFELMDGMSRENRRRHGATL